ncbi:MAG: hypothetical protein A2W25_05895 [candidate division Zixibacteria bacterium RBG_16_53_22]|nr:MAG: hypothetical protein A2W25_05895 [candidate division Zixibacteria bacterium RBG_16_53_22]
MNRDSIIKGLAILTAIGLVLFVGYSIVWMLMNSARQELRAEGSEPATLDANVTLKSTIDSLEIIWQNTQSHRFAVSQDPLFLGRVIKGFTYASAGYKETDEEDRIRLTATVVDDNPKAIIKYNGKSYVVQVGGWLEKAYRVTSIEEKQVVLEGGAGRLVLVNKPIQELETMGEDSDFSNNGSGMENY